MVSVEEIPPPVLSVQDLVVEFDTHSGLLRAVDGVSYEVHAGETLAVVGETGSGKTVTALAALGLLGGGRVTAGSVKFEGRDLLQLPVREMRRLLGQQLSMVFQDPSSALNPVLSIGRQVSEALLVHDQNLTRAAARRRALELLDLVGVPQPKNRYDQYPHQFSGGMCQRVVIAMAIANNPRVLVADEPTTAVDVTIQAQLLDLLRTAQDETGAATVLITHDLGVVAEMADSVCVMYAGRVVEAAAVYDLFARPRHPYTVGLLSCLPRLDVDTDVLVSIPGQPPDLRRIPPGCSFQPRCELSKGRDVCLTRRPELSPAGAPGQRSACHFSDEVEKWSRQRAAVQTGQDAQ